MPAITPFSLVKAAAAGVALLAGVSWLRMGAPGPAFFAGGAPAPAFALAPVERGEPFKPSARKPTFLLFWAAS